MATRPLPGFSNWYYDFQTQEDPALPRLWWPALMSESRSPSLLQCHYRWTVGLWYWRWALILVHQKPEPDIEFDDPELSLSEWVRWSANWSKGRLGAADIHALIEQKDQPWGRLVKFGAANYHYGRLVLAREAMAQSRARQKPREGNSPSSPSGKISEKGPSAQVGLEMPNLTLPDPSRRPHEDGGGE